MISVILLAAGSSKRFGEKDKLKALLGGIPIFLHSLVKFYKNPQINEIIIVTKEEELENYKILQKNFPKIKEVVIGGDERQESVTKGVEKVTNEILLIHNSSNPLVTDIEIEEVINGTIEYGACVPGLKSVNTIKQIDENMMVIKTIPRDNIYGVQTPQGVKTKIFKELIEKYKGKNFTDDVSYFEEAGLPVKLVIASENNFKITTAEDLEKAQSIIRKIIRIGIGHDSHRLFKGDKKLILGGVEIKSDYYLEGNSDGDVLTHALCNAIGTAIGEGSLSLYSDNMCKEGKTNSMEYLHYIYSEMKKRGYQIGNISISIEGKEPKLEKFIPPIKQNLALHLECTTLQIGIACTSGEGLTSYGKGEGLQCFVNLILTKT